VKLEQVNRSYWEDYSAHQTQIELLSVIKKEERTFDLVIIYDSTLDSKSELTSLQKELDFRRTQEQ
jgi:hypothetical protein